MSWYWKPATGVSAPNSVVHSSLDVSPSICSGSRPGTPVTCSCSFSRDSVFGQSWNSA